MVAGTSGDVEPMIIGGWISNGAWSPKELLTELTNRFKENAKLDVSSLLST